MLGRKCPWELPLPARAAAPTPVAARHRGAQLGIVRPVGALGGTGRRALRGYRGAHGDAPGKTLSVCYLPLHTQNSHAHCPWLLATAVRGMASCAPLVPRGAVPLR